MDDDRLMNLVTRDDAHAFGTLVERHDAALLRFAWRLLGNRAAAEDAVQDVWLRLWQTRSRYRGCGQLRAYLMRLVRNRCLDALRGARRDCAIADTMASSSDPATDARATALADAVQCAIAGLPDAQRVVFVLSVDEGLTYRQIAEALKCPLGTVASRKYHAVETLRLRLSDWRDGGDE